MAYLAGNTDVIRKVFYTIGNNGEKEYFDPQDLKVKLMWSPYETIDVIPEECITKVSYGIYEIAITWPTLVYDDIIINYEWIGNDGFPDRCGDKVEVIWALNSMAEAKDPASDTTISSDPLINKYYRAAENLDSFVAVYLTNDGRVATASIDNELSEGKIIGITTKPAIENQNAKIRVLDVVTNSDWDLETGAVYYLGLNGEIVNEKPATGFIQKIGIAITSDTLYLQILPDPEDTQMQEISIVHEEIKNTILNSTGIDIEYNEETRSFIFIPRASDIAFEPDGDISSNNVQGAITELKNILFNKFDSLGFEDLVDTPEYHDMQTMLLRVNPDNSVLEFVDPNKLTDFGEF